MGGGVVFFCFLLFAYVLPEETSLGGRHEESTKESMYIVTEELSRLK